MIEQYQPQIDEIQASLAREDLTKREKILWIFKIGKLSEKILSDIGKSVLLTCEEKDQMDWLDNWERAEMRLLLDEEIQSDDSYKEAASGH
jgi:hypothetical protein